MTTYVEARDAIVTHLNPAWLSGYPGVKIFYENTVQIDLDSVGDMFLTVSIDFQDSMRMDIDPDPISKTWGVVTLRLFSKEGTGKKSVWQAFNWLTALMKYRQLSGVTLGCPAPGKKIAKDGWCSDDLTVEFFFYQ